MKVGPSISPSITVCCRKAAMNLIVFHALEEYGWSVARDAGNVP
jgi:hypothetical protein